MFTFLGDVHTHVEQIQIPRRDSTVIQVGDLGIGLRQGLNDYTNLKQFGIDYFIRGNHDNPELCRNHPAYLGDYGYSQPLDLFFMSGAWSIDRSERIEGFDWWADEQLSYADANAALECYIDCKPRVVVTHDCPLSIVHRMGFKSLIGQHTPNITNQVLDAMLDYHQPDFHFFGHHHKQSVKVIGKTTYVCLGILQTITLDTERGLLV